MLRRYESSFCYLSALHAARVSVCPRGARDRRYWHLKFGLGSGASLSVVGPCVSVYTIHFGQENRTPK